jgi:hypothetical protein
MDVTKLFRWTGIIVLAAGLLVGSIIYRTRPAEDETDQFNKRDIYQLEKIGGKELVISAELTSWIARWWHGRRLAYTIVGLSGAVCAGCFWLAERKQ